MNALINYNLKKSWKLFLAGVFVLSVIGLSTIKVDTMQVNSMLFMTVFLGYCLSAFMPSYCFFKDCYKNKAIYSVRLSKLKSYTSYFSYLAVGLMCSLIMFCIILIIAILFVKDFEALIFDIPNGLIILPISYESIISFFILSICFPILLLFSSILLMNNKKTGMVFEIINLLAVFLSANYIINNKAVTNDYAYAKYLIGVIFILFILIIYCVSAIILSIKYLDKQRGER